MTAKKKARRRPKRSLIADPGAAPGSLKIDPGLPKPVIRVIAFDPQDSVEETVEDPSDLGKYLDKWPVVWINIDGFGDASVLLAIGEEFGLHRLALEDVVNLAHRPKVEPYENYLFVVARVPAASGQAETEQLSLFLGKNFVLTLQEKPGTYFESVRSRLRQGRAVIRNAGADYLAYSLIDAIVDAYFPVIEELGEDLEFLEAVVLGNPRPDAVLEMHGIKRRLQSLRRAIGPHREAINSLLRDSAQFISPETSVYLRDCYDHVVRLCERLEIYREQCADLMNIYLSTVSNRMNEVMKVLTIIATIFIPLSFIAGLYGMNFDPQVSRWNMPELSWVFGYPFALLVMGLTAAALVMFFWRKGWFD
jgi:magnesium transporter